MVCDEQVNYCIVFGILEYFAARIALLFTPSRLVIRAAPCYSHGEGRAGKQRHELLLVLSHYSSKMIVRSGIGRY